MAVLMTLSSGPQSKRLRNNARQLALFRDQLALHGGTMDSFFCLNPKVKDSFAQALVTIPDDKVASFEAAIGFTLVPYGGFKPA